MAHTFFQQMEAVPSGFLALGGKHYDSFMFSFKAPAIGKKLPYFQVAAQMARALGATADGAGIPAMEKNDQLKHEMILKH